MARPEKLNVDKVLGQFLSEGLSVSTIAAEHKVPIGTIYALLDRNAVPVRPESRITESNHEWDGLIEEYYKSPDPIAVVCARWGTSASVLYREIGRRGLSVRIRKKRRSPIMSREVAAVLRDLDD